MIPKCITALFLTLLFGWATAAEFPQNNTIPNFNTAGINLKTVRIVDVLGNRTVSYFLIGDLAILEGDLAYGTEADLLSKAVGNVQSRRSNSIFATGDPSGDVWPANTVIYKYVDLAFRAQFKTAVDAAIKRWTDAHPCLKFEERDPSASPIGIITIKPGGFPGVCWYGPGPKPGYHPGTAMAMGLVIGCGANEITHEFVSCHSN